jgi:hypothetical protein
MIARAYCHERAIQLWDERGKSVAFNVPKSARSRRRRHSDSECSAPSRARQGPWDSQPGVIATWSDRRAISPSVLPANFKLS